MRLDTITLDVGDHDGVAVHYSTWHDRVIVGIADMSAQVVLDLPPAAAVKLRDALLAALPLDAPAVPLDDECLSIMRRAHDDVTRALRLDTSQPGRESLGEGLVSDDTREWLRS